MALPTLEKTWQFNVNQQTLTSGVIATDGPIWMYKLKASLTGFASSPWTVVRSSNSVTAGASDLWLSSANVVWASSSSPRSWIVLQQAAYGVTPMQIMIDCQTNYAAQASFNLYVSHGAGFTGGTTSATPTATDQITAMQNQLWCYNSTVTQTTNLHVMQSTDGLCTRVWNFSGGVCRFMMLLESLADSLLPYKGLAHARGATPSMDIATFYSYTMWSGKFNSTTYYAYTGTEVYNGVITANANGAQASNINLGYPITPLSMHSETVGAKGRLGRLSDMYFGSPSMPMGATYPISPNDKEFVQFQPFVVPWNGTIPLLT